MVKRLSNFFKTTLHPEMYHGTVMVPSFFEGWYFKGSQRFVFIPGVFMGKTPEDSHAFVQVLEGASSRVEYHRYPIEKFWSAEDHFDLRIGENHFLMDRMRKRFPRLEIVATQAEGGLLLAPTPEGMGRRIAETLSATIHVRLVHLKSGIVEFDGKGDYAGLEAVVD